MTKEMDHDHEHDDNGEPTPRRAAPIKKAASDHKKDLAEREKEKNNKSIHDMEMEYRLAKKKKGASSSDAHGDGSLFGNKKIVYAPKKKKGEDDDGEARVAQSNHSFDYIVEIL
jgi:hypothetical protein